ncbi:MAG TPA: TIGR02117 family protein [Flavobacterium sp.]|uniref:TIGR02117 family protein n=2 Tax=Flavobacterium TaxID=237 RepID=UPI0025C5701F|nr:MULTISPECIES: TIGR02117 family protein [unclassified Flavobacterium]HRE79016.1 TIGR02117 family protein [Flavobacterium sp.]
MKIVKLTFKLLLKFVLSIILLLLIYGISAVIFSIIPVNKNQSENAKEYEIYIKSNGVHTDLVLPIKTDLKDWSEKIKFEKIKSKDSTHQFLAFGWGDKGFYLDTPEWSDLKFSTAFNAAFNLGTSAMHTTFYKQIQENESCVKIEISKEQYQKLITFIEASFQYDTNGNPIFIDATTYGKNDSFYEAHRTYNLFYTCNTWANQALKKANMKAAFWTPADKGIFYHYQ